jgi:alpha/beta superfamily hydrolase
VLESLTITSADGTVLEAEYRAAHQDRDQDGHDSARAACVLCHPHPQYGGSMHSLVIGELFRELPAHGVTCLRFNFRGVEGSGGGWDEGRGERADVAAALDALAGRIPRDCVLVLVGWSFGADMALSTHDPRVAGWLAIAPPLYYADPDAVRRDTRPKHLVLAERDQVRAPDDLRAATADWTTTTTEVIGGADHFFMGRTERVVTAARDFVARLVEIDM